MRTLGIDLASQSAKTAACLIDWNESPPAILTLEIGLTDKGILDLADQLDLRTASGAEGDAIAIDAPFGWPQPFIEFVTRSPTGKRVVSAWTPTERKRLAFRLTDLYVQQTLGLWPLAVAADKIALPAMRCSDSSMIWACAIVQESMGFSRCIRRRRSKRGVCHIRDTNPKDRVLGSPLLSEKYPMPVPGRVYLTKTTRCAPATMMPSTR